MNCIDALEGSAKQIIIEIHKNFVAYRLDNTEFIQNIKAVISGVDAFVRHNPEMEIDPALLEKILYAFSKTLWLDTLLETDPEASAPETDGDSPESLDYYHYCFDYIYHHNVYPQ